MMFGDVEEPLASCVVVNFFEYISKGLLVCKFDTVNRIFVDDLPLYSCLYITQVLLNIFPLKRFYYKIAFFY